MDGWWMDGMDGLGLWGVRELRRAAKYSTVELGSKEVSYVN